MGVGINGAFKITDNHKPSQTYAGAHGQTNRKMGTG